MPVCELAGVGSIRSHRPDVGEGLLTGTDERDALAVGREDRLEGVVARLGQLAVGELARRPAPSADPIRPRLVDVGGNAGLLQAVGTAEARQARADDDYT